MAKLTLEGFAQEVSQALGKRLVSLLLYGSTARRPGVHVAGRGRADVNTLLICDAADEHLFASLGPVVRSWVRAGHRAPLIFTEREWRESADAFPIEYADLREAHRVLAGGDPWPGITVERADVRRQLEHELKGKLVRLRQAYAALRGDQGELARVIAGSTGGFFTMLRAALRLAGRTLPDAPEALVREAGTTMGWPPESLTALVAHATDGRTLKLGTGDPLPAAYLAALERTAEFVNRLT
ncbi:MAG: hypothetical protein DMD49_05310 [Gemmatimonadetes bacterium]|nr:MAG: hypothetical protein DMD49_05310 [Gemmatimonadota bacterium]